MEYTLSEHVKPVSKVSIFYVSTIVSTALILLGMGFTRAALVVAGILFHSSIITSWSCWLLDTWHLSTFCLRMPHRCSIGFRSVETLGHFQLQCPHQGSCPLDGVFRVIIMPFGPVS